jgi:hypothetical protein
MLPAERQAKRVLELYLYGGMNAFDTFYTVPTWGMNDERFLHAYYPRPRRASPTAGSRAS